jgi:hypothetical protein
MTGTGFILLQMKIYLKKYKNKKIVDKKFKQCYIYSITILKNKKNKRGKKYMKKMYANIQFLNDETGEGIVCPVEKLADD